MSVRKFLASVVIALAMAAGAGIMAVPANAATAAVDIQLTQKLTSHHKAKVKFCNNLNQSVDIWVGKPKHEGDSFRRVWPHKCATFTTKRTSLGFWEYTRTDGDVDKGKINTRTGHVSFR